MGKVILLVILLLGAGFYFPTTRPTLVDALGPIINPAFIFHSGAEMEKIARELQIITREAQPIPAMGQDFAEWMNRNFLPESTRDSWGNEYRLINWNDSVGIVSPGPDLEIGTEDDLIRTQRIQRWSSVRRRR